MSSGTPCPTDTAPLGRQDQAGPGSWPAFSHPSVLASLFCPTALAAEAFYKCMPAAPSGLGKLGGCEGLVHGWRAGAASPLGLERTVVQTSSSAVHSQLGELMLVRHHLLAWLCSHQYVLQDRPTRCCQGLWVNSRPP